MNKYNISQLCTPATEEAVEQRVNIVAASNVTSRGYVLMSTVKENWAAEQRRHNRSTPSELSLLSDSNRLE